LRARFPARGETFRALLAALSLAHLWSVFQFLYQVPALILRETLAGLLGILAYTLVWTFVDGAAFTLLLWLAAGILPAAVLRRAFVPASALILLWSFLWAAAFHYADWFAITLGGGSDFALIVTLGFLIFAYIAVVIPLPRLARQAGARRFGESAAERLSALGMVFLSLDAASLLVVLARNLL
jgi:hypothetical protein